MENRELILKVLKYKNIYLITIYLSHFSHSKVDDAVGYLKTRLKQVGLLNKANLIITSDHGMTEIRPQWKTDLVKILQKAGISKSSYQISSKSPVLQISQKGGTLQ